MIVFHTDLDNTLIYSYKHDIGTAKRCVEVYQGREISFITERTYALLHKLKDIMAIVPTTTRTVEQYERIDMGIGRFPYALVCNGGILLVDGKEDARWYQQSLELISDCAEELAYGEILLAQDQNRCFEVRNIRGLFLFTKSEKPAESVELLKKQLDTSVVDVFSNGMKVYVVPKQLNKGIAVQRLKKRLQPDYLIAAGDSEFDVPMLLSAHLGLAPEQMKKCAAFAGLLLRTEKSAGQQGDDRDGEIWFARRDQIFSEELLEYILEKVKAFGMPGAARNRWLQPAQQMHRCRLSNYDNCIGLRTAGKDKSEDSFRQFFVGIKKG